MCVSTAAKKIPRKRFCHLEEGGKRENKIVHFPGENWAVLFVCLPQNSSVSRPAKQQGIGL